ncbi:hypothetical protein ACTJJE_18235 [Mycolicibacterium sp. 22603]|uniref:hypothetical protein n=1 Tax=Mycolicibacterium sp. 22603 TaxID=3453950 RepID=UPI003F82422D
MVRSPRTAARPSILALLVTSGLVTGACGIRVENIAAPVQLPAATGTSALRDPAASVILTPCIPGEGRPHAVSEVGVMLLGKDLYAVDCEHRVNSGTVPTTRTDKDVNADLAITDELVSAVLVGTGGFGYQPVIGLSG